MKKNFFISSAKFFALICVLLLSVGNAWAIDWTNYASPSPTNGEKYILFSNNTKSGGSYTMAHFLKAPDSKPTGTTVDRTVFLTDNAASATWFTFHKESGENNNYKISYSYTEGATEKTGYITTQWGESTGGKYTDDWRSGTSNISILEFGTRGNYNNTLNDGGSGTNAKYIYAMKSSTKYVLAKNGSNAELRPWILITTEAYADATATNQYYWTANAVAYTDGAVSTAGGTATVAKTTYNKPNKSNLGNEDYATSVTGQKGNDSAQPTITVYYKATLTPGYEFLGWFAAAEGGSALSTALEYNYEFPATSTDSNNKTTKNLYARFHELPSVANLYVGGTGEPTEYKTLGAAITAASNGDRIALVAEIGEGALTIDKNITLDFNGYKIQGSANNLVTVTGNVTFTDSQTTPGGVTTTGATAVLVSGGSLTINDGKYAGATYAVERTGGSVTIKSGGFAGGTQDINGTITLDGGYFVHSAGLNIEDTYAVTPYIPLGMKYSEGYNFMVISKSSPNYPICTVLLKEKVILPETYTFNILSSINFSTLEAAIAYTTNNTNGENEYKDIIMREDYTLSAGNYTITDGTTLVIPYSKSQIQACPQIDRVESEEAPDHAYRTLTLVNGVHMEVFGAIEAGGIQATGEQKSVSIACPGVSTDGGTYGLLQMNEGSSITMNSGSCLYAWGYVQGAGTIDVRRGAEVREQFQVNDWKTLLPIYRMSQYSSVNYHLHVLPINQYFIQNVEVKTTYRPGSRLLAQVSAYVWNMSINFNDIGIIGVKYSAAAKAATPGLKDDVAIFLMDNEDDSEDTWVCKSYDVANDVQLYEVNNSAYLGSLKMDVVFNSPIDLSALGFGTIDGLDVDSRNFALPLTNNFKIHLKSGKLAVTQDTELLPGSEIEVNKKATLTINSGQTLYLYDADQWHKYVSGEVQESLPQSPLLFGYASHIKYRQGGTPDNSVRDISSPEALGDAKLTVKGTVDVKGYLKTTTGDMRLEPSAITLIGPSQHVMEVNTLDPDPESLGGASITSTIADAGTIVFSNAAPAINTEIRKYDYTYKGTTYNLVDVSDYLWQVDEAAKIGNDVHYIGDHVIPALLKNDGDNNYTHTANTAAGKSFCFVDMDGDGNGEWTCLTDAGCFVYDQNNIYYIKPQAYVPISVGAPVAEADHTYRDHYAGTDKIYIKLDDCQWWEVVETETPGIFHCEHPLNDTYFYWNGTKWAEKRYNITFKTYDGTTLEFKDKNGVTQDHYELTYGTTPNWLGDVPQRLEDNSYTYTFAGWTPTPYPVNKDEVYTAKYTTTPRMYLIRFEDQAHNLIENRYLTWGETPTCASYTPGANEQWEPAIGIVAGDATYTLATKKTNGFTIRFVNYDGTLLDELTGVALNTPAEDILMAYDGGTPTKEAIEDEEYSFNEWSPTVVAATEDATYTATFTATTPTFAIKFYQEDGTTQIGETQNVKYGVMPEVPSYSKAATDAETYTLVWSPLVGAVNGAQNYTATFTEQPRMYTVTWKNYDGTTIKTDQVNYGATPAYSGLTPAKEDETKIYGFTGWGAISAVTGDQEYTAQFDAGHLKTVEVALNTTNSTSGHVETLILKASEDGSGQLTGNITATNAYYDLKFTDGSRRHWHAFGVPWQVNLDTDPIQEIDGDGNVVRTFVLGRDYDIIYYNTAKRAAQGPGAHCWEYVEHNSHILQPGQGYMIAFTSDVQTIRFAKKAYTPVIFSGTVNVTAEGSGDDQGINAIANPKAFKATMNAGPTVGYVHDGGEIGSDGYEEYDIENRSYIVGKAVYIQVRTPRTVAIAQSNADPISPASAPARRAARATDKEYLSMGDYYHVSISSETQKGGSVYVLPEEDKQDEYVVGHDLAKFGMSSKKAQIWVNRYGTKLGLNTTAPVNEVAEFPISVYAPAAGEYTIDLQAQPDEEYTVYLTQNGEAIWNLSESAYTFNLNAGVNKTYGLRLSARKSPSVATGTDEALVDAQGDTRKVLINNQVFIIREGNVYTIDGKLVK